MIHISLEFVKELVNSSFLYFMVLVSFLRYPDLDRLKRIRIRNTGFYKVSTDIGRLKCKQILAVLSVYTQIDRTKCTIRLTVQIVQQRLTKHC